MLNALQELINLLPKKVKLTNCRVLPLELPSNLKTQIVGFAHPSRYHGKNNENTVMEMIACRSQTLISLDPIHWALEEIFRKSGGKYYCLPVTDFKSPTLEQFKHAYRIVKESAADYKHIAVHCGEGYGRTGTMLAGILLQAQLEYLWIKSPQVFWNYPLQVGSTINLGHYSTVPQVQTTELVARVIKEARAPRIEPAPFNTDGESVENKDQVLGLMKLENMLVKEYLSKLSHAAGAYQVSADDSISRQPYPNPGSRFSRSKM